jgi:hypothetical protein
MQSGTYPIVRNGNSHMNAEARYETDIDEERHKTVKPLKKVWKYLSYVGFAVIGYVSAIAIVVLLIAALNS